MGTIEELPTPELRARALATRLRKLRARAGMSQEKVAELAGIATYTYQKFENGESRRGEPLNPRLHTLLSLAEALEVSLLELLTPEAEDQPADARSEPEADAAPEHTRSKTFRTSPENLPRE